MKPERVITIPGQNSDRQLLSRADVEALLKREARPESAVLSLYLDTDQSDAVNLERGFGIVFKNMLRDIELQTDKNKRQELKDDAEVVLRFLDDYRDIKRALVVFCDASEGFLWIRELAAKVPNILRWLDRPYVRPLLELIDEQERYGVILADRSKARLFTIFLGEIEEHKEAFAQADVKHIKTSGTDHLRSQMNIQRKADLHARWHLKEVSKTMARLALQHSFDRLILGGPVEATSELMGLLPKTLRARVVTKVALPVAANTGRVLAETLKIEAEVERKREVDLVESLITAARKKEKAVLGLEETLLALQEVRVWQLVYADGFHTSGGQCTSCEALSSSDRGPCGYCGKPVRAINDFIQIAVERVMDLDGKIEQVRGPAAERLNEVGGLGAVLHY
jgi:peptide chain release factor subunit 1